MPLVADSFTDTSSCLSGSEQRRDQVTVIVETDFVGRCIRGTYLCAPAYFGNTGEFFERTEGLQMPADHPHTEIIAGKGLVSTLKAQASQAVIYCFCTIIAERVV